MVVDVMIKQALGRDIEGCLVQRMAYASPMFEVSTISSQASHGPF